jgi:hypothetical protein
MSVMNIVGIARRILLSLGLVVLAAAPAVAQFTAAEIAQREHWEDFLLTADIVRTEPLGEGVTAPTLVFLKKGGVECRAVWKDANGMVKGAWVGWAYEIAAYRLDKLLDLHMVPVTVERKIKGRKGDLAMWAEHKTSLLKVEEEGPPIPAEAMPRTTETKYITRFWDSLIANLDRTQQNILYTEDWRTILIDHAQGFQSSQEHSRNLLFGAKGLLRTSEGAPFLFRRLPRALVERVRALTFDSVKQAVGPYLSDAEIKALIARRKLALDEIAEMIRQNGEDQVLY